MSKSKRKVVTEQLETLSPWDICDGDLKDIIEHLTLRETSYTKQGYSDLKLDYNDAYDSFSCVEIELYGTRDENDAEYNKRVKAERKAREKAKQAREIAKRVKAETEAKQEENEKAELARLIKKHGIPEVIK